MLSSLAARSRLTQAARAQLVAAARAASNITTSADTTNVLVPEPQPVQPGVSGSAGTTDTTYSSTIPSQDPAAEQSQSFYTGPPKLVVFGGRGFVGSAICREALKTGLQVVAISPSGTPPAGHEGWTSQVDWVRGNALEPASYQHQLEGSLAAISCVGGFGSNEKMRKINGTANVRAIEACKAQGVPRFVYISATTPQVPGIDYMLGGYIQGKREAEEALLREYPKAGVALRPWIIYGSRAISNHVSLPLNYVFGPAEYLLNKLPARQLTQLPLGLGSVFYPPISVDVIAKAAVAAATDSSVPPGIWDVWQLSQYK